MVCSWAGERGELCTGGFGSGRWISSSNSGNGSSKLGERMIFPRSIPFVFEIANSINEVSCKIRIEALTGFFVR
jgi:hypothetical protein